MTGNQAGQSAHEVAQRTRAKITRLQRSADAWEVGADGERATAQALAGLDPATWTVLHDIRWPGRARANIDHVVIGPPGVFVIDSKNWTGTVQVAEDVLRQNGRSREKAVDGAAEASVALLELVPDIPVYSVLCLVRDEPTQGWVRDVMLCSTANVRELISTQPSVLSSPDVRRVAAALEAGVTRSASAPQPTARPAAARSRGPRPGKSKRSGPSTRRLLGILLIGILMIGALQSGLFAAVASKISDVVVTQIVDEEPPAEPGRTKKDKRRDSANRSG